MARYLQKGVLVDTNLLIDFLIGKFDRQQLANCRATMAFDSEDFDLLESFLGKFRCLVTTYIRMKYRLRRE